jgi:GNAT superfamily N-acetyltransferase
MTEIREASPEDASFLREMLFLSIHVPPGEAPPPRAILEEPDILRYQVGFGRRPGDWAGVAEIGDEAVGAAWFRCFSANAPGYGFVRDDIPELGIALIPDARGRGIGTLLLTTAVNEARRRGHPGLSLSVDPRNPAQRLYRRMGFRELPRTGGGIVMIREWDDAPPALDRGLVLRRAGRLGEALRVLSAVHAADPTPLSAYWAGVTFDNLGAESLAAPLYREALALGLGGEERPWAEAYLASSLTVLGRFHEAIPLAEAAREGLPDDPVVLTIAARAYGGAGDWEQAARLYGRAVGRDAASGPAWRGLGQALGALGFREEAEAAFRRAWALGHVG